MTDKQLNTIASIFKILSGLILLSSVVLAIIWNYNQSLNLEPTLVLLGLIYSIVTIFGAWIVKLGKNRLRKEKLTLPYALAYGYLNNYLAPVIRGLRKKEDNPNQIKFYVYIPNSLKELHNDSIDETISELQNRDYTIETIELEFPNEKRSKDYRTAIKNGNSNSIKYFDFPTTLLTLEEVVDFKLETKKDSRIEEEKEKLAKEYISNFNYELNELIKKAEFDAIRNNIKIIRTNDRFSFLET